MQSDDELGTRSNQWFVLGQRVSEDRGEVDNSDAIQRSARLPLGALGIEADVLLNAVALADRFA